MTSSDELVVLLLIVFLGVTLGRVSCRGLSLGTSGVIFVALLAGHLGYSVPENAGLLGLVVFVYCLGINAGPRFFRTFRAHASSLAIIGVAMIIAAATATWVFARVIGLPADLAAGIFAGALTSTPALAAAAETLPPDSQLAVGFGLAYPFGAIGVVLFVQLAPRILRRPQDDDRELQESDVDTAITYEYVEVMNPSVTGKRLSDLSILGKCNCQIPRARVGEQMQPIPADFTLQPGQQVLVIGAEADVDLVIDFLGKKVAEAEFVLDMERQRRRVVATSDNVVGDTLQELHLRTRFGVTISRVMRHDLEFVPDARQTIQFGDALTAIGEPEGLNQFVEFAGHRERSFDETDMISLSVGMLLGVLLGRVSFQLGSEAFSVGMAGGPLMVGLILGHFGRIGPLVGHFPRAARLLLTEIGLAMFLASAGIRAGGQLLPVIREYGTVICLGAIVITIVPLIVGMLLSRYSIQMGILQSLGGICGAMTSTPGLGALTSKIDSNVPVTSYASVYPVALILMSVLAPILVSVMS